MATAPPTAIRPAEAPRVKSRSRRDGTWKECTTRTATSRTVRGLTTDVMPPAGELTEWKNQTQAAMAPTATMTFTHPGGRARVACEKAMPADTSTMAPSRRRPADLLEGGAGGDRHQHGAQAGEPQPDGVLGQPRLVGPADRRDDAHGARRRPGRGAGRRRAGRPPHRGPVPRPPSCRGGRASPLRGGRRPKPGRPSATRSAASGSAGSSTVIVTGSAAGCSSSRTIMWPAWAVERQCTMRRGSPGTYGRAPRGRPMSERGRSRTSPAPSSGRRGTGWARPQRGATWSAEGRGSRTRFVHHCNANGAAEATSRMTASWTPRRTGSSVTMPSAAPRRPAGPTKASGPGGSTGRTRSAAAGPDLHLQRQAGAAVTRRALHADPGPGHDHEGPDDPDEEGTEDEVAEELHPSGPCVVGDQPPQADDEHARGHRRPRAGRSRPVAHGLGAGVDSRSSRITAADGRRRRRPRR